MLRADALAAWHAGLAAADARAAVERALARRDLAPWRNADLVVATGKAAAAMARGVGDDARGFVLLPDDVPAGDLPPGMKVLRGSHPVPSIAGIESSTLVMRAVGELGASQRFLYLISGGTSALFEIPRDGVTTQSLIDLYTWLVVCGASIDEINVVRRALSKVKGGGVARAASSASVLTLAVSDVVGDDPATIGSGPTVAICEDGRAVRRLLERYGLWDRVGDDVKRVLAELPPHAAAAMPATSFEVVCSASRSVEAARSELRARCYDVVEPPMEYLSGDAVAAATTVAAAIERLSATAGERWGFAIGGETTLRLGNSVGRGGRNQHAGAAIALALQGREGVTCVVAGTDGSDGNSGAAGAVVDGGTVARAARAGHDLAASLAGFDSASALGAAGDTLTTGATGTNVGDLLVAVGSAGPAVREQAS